MGLRQSTETEPQRASQEVQRGDPMVNDFIQSVFQNNEELGFLPFRIDQNTGLRNISKAFMKKATPHTLHYDVDDTSFTFEPSQQDPNVYNLNFKIDCLCETQVSIWFGAREIRQDHEGLNTVMNISSVVSKEYVGHGGELGFQKFVFYQGHDQKLPTG